MNWTIRAVEFARATRGWRCEISFRVPTHRQSTREEHAVSGGGHGTGIVGLVRAWIDARREQRRLSRELQAIPGPFGRCPACRHRRHRKPCTVPTPRWTRWFTRLPECECGYWDARWDRGPEGADASDLQVKVCGPGIAYPGIEGAMPTWQEEAEIDEAMRAPAPSGSATTDTKGDGP